MACVYQHIRLDTGEPFYIGISKYDFPGIRIDGFKNNHRACKTERKHNPHFNSIHRKFETKVEIIHNEITFEEAIQLEKFYIKKYGRKNIETGILVNLTDGGEGCPNALWTEEMRKNHSENNPIKNPATYIKMCETIRNQYKSGRVSWMKNKSHSDETKKIIKEKRAKQIFSEESKIKRGKTVSSLIWMHHIETKKNCRIKNDLLLINKKIDEGYIVGRYYITSDETKNKLKLKLTGIKKPPMSEEQKQKISKTLREKKYKII
jgi:hypothetical protein